MTEKQILKKIDKWDEEDKISKIIKFIEDLPVEQKTPNVLSELGRAYNNVYWANSTEENKKYLEKAVSVFKYIEGDVPSYSWHYRIGYAYFYLDDIEKVKEHMSQTRENNSAEMLSIALLAEKKGLKPSDICEEGNVKDEFLAELFLDVLSRKAPSLLEVLAKGVDDAELDKFENKIGERLLEVFRCTYKKFNGQTDKNVLLFNNSKRFVSLFEVEELQAEWVAFLEQHYGKDWDKITLSEEHFYDDDVIKNQLFSEKWIPFVVTIGENGVREFLCFDFDPLQEISFGQLINIKLSDKIENYRIDFVEYDLSSWMSEIIDKLNVGKMIYSPNRNSLLSYDEENDTRMGDFTPAYYTEEERISLEDYITENFGEFDDVFHELVSLDIHCDVYLIKPTPERNYYSLVTGGMGAFDMFVPEGYEGSPNIELMINLPPDWNLKSDKEKHYWPIRWLKLLARLPIEQQTYLGWGHTIPTGEVLEGTDFSCIMLIDAQLKNGQLAEVKLPTGRTVWFFMLVPLYEEEMLFKLENTAEALAELFEENEIPYPPVVDLERKNLCAHFQPSQNNSALDSVLWAFNKNNYSGLMQFWEDVTQYNAEVNNDLEHFNPFGTIFNTPKVKVIYEAWIESEKDLFSLEKFIENPEDIFDGDSAEDGLYQTEIIAEFESGDGKVFGALELLWNIQNCLKNKELGDHIFFEGFQIEGYEEDGTPVLYLHLGS